MLRKVSLLIAALITVAGVSIAAPAYAGRSACPGTYICSWNNAGWTGTMAAFNSSFIYQNFPNHCENFDNTAEQDAISSLASYQSAPNFHITFFKNVNCDYNGGSYVLFGTNQVKDLAGTGFNDTFSSVEAICC